MKNYKLLAISILFFCLSLIVALGICRANAVDPFTDTVEFLEQDNIQDEDSWFVRLITPDIPYDTTEKTLFGSLIATNAADAATTIIALNKGAAEANPFYGDSPSSGAIILTKTVATGLVAICARYLDHMPRKIALGAATIILGAVTVHNINVINDMD